MSTTLSTQDMVADLQSRIPMGLDSLFCMAQINKAFRWIEQQGAFTWNLAYSDLTVQPGTFFVAPADMPSRFDPGKPVSIYGYTASIAYGIFGASIPYVPPDRLSLHQLYHTPAHSGIFSVFTIVTNIGIGGGTLGLEADTTSAAPPPGSWPTEVPYILFAPSSAVVSILSQYHCIYHQIPLVDLTLGSTTYYPTPDPFDDLIVDLAEGEIKRIYNLTMWEAAIQKAQNSSLLLLDKYRSPRQELAGLTDQAKETQESQLKKAQ